MKQGIRRMVPWAVCLWLLLGPWQHASAMGLSDFLTREAGLPWGFELILQKELAQQGGEMPHVTCTIKEAASDGVGLYLLMELKTTNPRDIILLRDHADGVKNIRPQPRLLPLWDQMHDDQTRIYINVEGAICAAGGTNLIIGYDWTYPSTDTLLLHAVLDVRRGNGKEGPLPLTLTLGEYVRDQEGIWRLFAGCDIALSPVIPKATHDTYEAALPIALDNLNVETLTIISTPLALYTTVRAVRPNGDGIDDWLVALLDGEQNPFTPLLSTYAPIPEGMQSQPGYGPDGQALDNIYAPTTRPLDAVTLRVRPGQDPLDYRDIPVPLSLQ